MYPDSSFHFRIFTPDMRKQITRLTSQGASIMASGSFIASDIWANHNATDIDRSFASAVLGYRLRTPKASNNGMVREVPSRFKTFDKGNFQFNTKPTETMYPVESPDGIAPASDMGAVIMRYADTGNSAAIAVETPVYRTIVMGFPLESIISDQQIEHIMKQSLNFLNPKHHTK